MEGARWEEGQEGGGLRGRREEGGGLGGRRARMEEG